MTTSELMQLLVCVVNNIAQAQDFVFAGENGQLSNPTVYKYFLPPRNKHEQSKKSYIVVQLGKEKQDLQEPTDESHINFQIVLGIYHDSLEIDEGMDALVIALEWLETEIKNIVLLGDIAELKTIEKDIPHEQPIPYYEGVIKLAYSYYKPVLRPEP